MSDRVYHEGHVVAKGDCPLCGKRIVRTAAYSIETRDEMVYSLGLPSIIISRGDPIVLIEWICESGCHVSVKGSQPLTFFETNEAPQEKVPEALTGESLRQLVPKAEQAKHALVELEEGIEHDRAKSEGGSGSKPR